MKARFIAVAAVFAFAPVGCGGSTPEPVAPPPPPPPPAEGFGAGDELEELTEEERAQEEAARRLAEDRAQMEAEAQKEFARWTPELRAEARALAETEHATLKEAVEAALAGNHRKPGHSDRDRFRNPLETLEFVGLKPDMTVLEYGPGAGWYTEILAPVLAARGKLIVTTTDPAGPQEERSTFYAQRLKLFLDKSPELFGKVERAVFNPEQPDLGLEGVADLALVIRGMHHWVERGKSKPWLATIHKALKPGGILGIVQHRAAEGADPMESAPQGYLPEAWVIEHVEAAGFKLDGKSEVNANPKDTKDHEHGVWSLPPTLRDGEVDRKQRLEIGESDRMTLRFVKTEAAQ